MLSATVEGHQRCAAASHYCPYFGESGSRNYCSDQFHCSSFTVELHLQKQTGDVMLGFSIFYIQPMVVSGPIVTSINL